MALQSNALFSVQDARDILGVDGPERLTEIEQMVNRVSDVVEDRVGYELFSQTYTNELYDGTGHFWLLFDHEPITALTKIEALMAVMPEQWLDVSLLGSNLSDYLIDRQSKRMIISRNLVFWHGTQNWRITATAGYTPSTLPAVIIETAKSIMLRYWKLKDMKLVGVSSISIERGQTETYQDGLTRDEKDALDVYRRRSA